MRRASSVVLSLALLGAACGSSEQDPANGSGGAGSGASAGTQTSAGSAGNPAGGANAAGTTAGGAGGTVGTGGTAGANLAGSGGVTSDCSAQLPDSLFCKPLGSMPKSIKATGLFPSAPNLNQHPQSLLEYAPDPPLWSDGMDKQRFLLLPTGKKIDNQDRKRWVFPEGTIAVKTFFDDSGPQGVRRPIETRLVRAGMGGAYQFYLYQWNADGSDAALVVDDIEGDLNAEVPVNIIIKRMVSGQPFALNNGQPFAHALPSRNACGTCHEQNGMVAQTFIGFDELRLASKLTPEAPKTQLQTFADAGIFSQPPPAEPATITDTSNDGGRMLRIKRFAFGNCVTCHNGEGQFDLHPDVLVANTVGKPTEAQSVMPPAGWLRVVPGDPLTSVLYVQMQRTMLPPPVDGKRLRAMPPVGLADVAVEQSTLKDVFDWISSLPKQ